MLAVGIDPPAHRIAVLECVAVAGGDALAEAAVLLEPQHRRAGRAGDVRGCVRRPVVDDQHVGVGQLGS